MFPGFFEFFCLTYITYTGWWFQSEKYKFVSWDDEIPKIWKIIKFMFQSTDQYIISNEDVGHLEEILSGKHSNP